jgi:Flp pilus assembly protein TadG
MEKRIKIAAKGRFALVDSFLRNLKGGSGAQSMVEFAFALPVLLIVLVVGIQFAIIGEAALALGQVNYQGARYAAVNGNATQDQVNTYMLSVASPTISANGGTYLHTTLTGGPPCTFGSPVTVSLTYDASNLLALPNPFLGIQFPVQLTSSESAFCEGSTN